jgi:hypothetical protein
MRACNINKEGSSHLGQLLLVFLELGQELGPLPVSCVRAILGLGALPRSLLQGSLRLAQVLLERLLGLDGHRSSALRVLELILEVAQGRLARGVALRALEHRLCVPQQCASPLQVSFQSESRQLSLKLLRIGRIDRSSLFFLR